MNLYLVRHGTTEWNRLDLVQGQADLPLDKGGRREVEKAAQDLSLRSLRVDGILTSPLQRATEIAQILSQALSLTSPPETFEEFREFQCGLWEGVHFLTVRQDPRYEYERVSHDASYPIPGGESFLDVVRRVEKGWKRVEELYAGKDILLVTHVVVTRALLFLLFGFPYETLRSFRLDNAGFCHLQKGEHRYYLRLWNHKG